MKNERLEGQAAIEAVASSSADLRDMPWMPLDLERLRRSKAWLAAKRQPELAFYMINLWTASWHERPAGSLEDDDDVLADLAMCDPKKWGALKEKVLRGWMKREDGRLYHSVVCEYAFDTWVKKKNYRDRANAAREAKKRKSISVTQSDTGDATEAETDHVTSHVIDAVTEPVTGPVRSLKGEGEGEGEGDYNISDANASSIPPLWVPPQADPPDELLLAFQAYNRIAERAGLPKAQALNAQRKAKLKRRLADCGGLDGWLIALEKLEASGYCRGEGDRGWRADLDFMLQEKSFTKLVEGSYDDYQRPGHFGQTKLRNRNEPVSLIAVAREVAALDPDI